MKLNKIKKLRQVQNGHARDTERREKEREREEEEEAASRRLPIVLNKYLGTVLDEEVEVVIEDEGVIYPEQPAQTPNEDLQVPHQAPSKVKKQKVNGPDKIQSHIRTAPDNHPKQDPQDPSQTPSGPQAHPQQSAPLESGPSIADRFQQRLREVKKTVCFSNSLIEPVQTLELKNHLIGKLARVFCMYRVNEIAVYNDEAFARDKRASGFDPTEFIVKILQYVETPQYLRKRLFPISALLKNVGLLIPLECQHHLKAQDVSEYREGVVLRRPVGEGKGSWVDIGLTRDCRIDQQIQENVRVTVRIDNYAANNPKRKLTRLLRPGGLAPGARADARRLLGLRRERLADLLRTVPVAGRKMPQGPGRPR